MKSQTSPNIPNGSSLPRNPRYPSSVLVETITHLVPEDGIYQDPRNDRLMSIGLSYGANFAYTHRRCYFVVDYGTSETDDVPVTCYEWTGQAFKRVQEELKKAPSSTFHTQKKEKRPVREKIRFKLRGAARINDMDVDWLEHHREDMEWLRGKLRPRFWDQLLVQIEEVWYWRY
ncbi:hypothetical protein BDV25DRAFT_126215 [Aspergillus avenaceus]|uniref:Uncharacterized protein n=1 Tax=Aspergillus avenaceus TaxID=36643 RepID=A0A5N6U907_ASPAV|nr:hypothetical protein BDV25DRAFT_126215 [Aspergillus avenaceus]